MGCRARRPQAELVRVVAVGGAVHVGLGAGAGRGAYVCPALPCLAAAGRGRLARALRAPVAVPAPGALAAMVRVAAERKVAALLGQGRRMGRVASGHEAVAERVHRGQAALLLVTRDASAEGERLAAAAAAAGIPVGRALTREALGAALGASPRWAAAVEDPQIAAGVRRYLAFMMEAGAGGCGGPGGVQPSRRSGGNQGG